MMTYAKSHPNFFFVHSDYLTLPLLPMFTFDKEMNMRASTFKYEIFYMSVALFFWHQILNRAEY